MIRVFRYRMSPTRSQEDALRKTTELLRELYNAALQHRRDAYRRAGVAVSKNQQMLELKDLREIRPEYALIYSQVLQDVIERADRAYRAFFRRVRLGEKPGFPRFKGRGSYRAFTFKQADKRRGVSLVAGGKRVRLFGIGNVKVKLHRPLEGRVKQVWVKLCGDGHWYIGFVCDDVPRKPLPSTGASVGVDVGIVTFAALSDGTRIGNPRPFETAQRELRKVDRRVSRREPRSHRRRKAAAILAKRHHRIACVRRDFHHKVALDLVRRFDAIYFEDLNIKGLARMALAKQVLDAAWGQFGTITSNKAECAGRWFSRSNPRGTSQDCSGCDEPVPKGTGVRIHSCPRCGLVLDRDVNAARNIKSRGQRDRGGTIVGSPEDPRSSRLAACG